MSTSDGRGVFRSQETINSSSHNCGFIVVAIEVVMMEEVDFGLKIPATIYFSKM